MNCQNFDYDAETKEIELKTLPGVTEKPQHVIQSVI